MGVGIRSIQALVGLEPRWAFLLSWWLLREQGFC